MRIGYPGEGEGLEAEILQEMTAWGKAYGVASAMRLSCTRPGSVALRKRMVSRASISNTFFTVWHFFLPL